MKTIRLYFYPAKKLFITSMFLCLSTSFSVLQAQSSEGTEFWFGFMEHRDIGLNSKVAMITSRFNTSGTITIPGLNWSENFSVTANDVTIISLPSDSEVVGSESIDHLGILLTSNLPISLYIHQYYNFRSEASIVLPQTAIGDAYYVMSYEGIIRQNTIYPSEFLIIATEDETTVTITLSDDTKEGRLANSSFNVLMNKGDTYQVQGLQGTSDLTGTHVVGDKKIALFGGNRWTEVPVACEARDNLMEQMTPITTWGKEFVTVPNNNVNFDVYRILAAEDNTTINIHDNTTTSYTLNAGQFIEYQKSTATYIKSDKSILLAQFNVGQNCNGLFLGDPSMVLLNSIEQTRDTLTLYNSSFENITENYINITMSTFDVPFVKIDGQNIDGNYPINTVGLSDEYSYARIQVNSGSHTITSGGCGIIATVYGYGDAESYAYNGGAGFRNINANPIPEGGCLNDTIFFDTGLPEPKYSFFWELGDGNTSTEGVFNHYYPDLGHYPVSLIVTNNCLETIDTFYQDLLISLRQAVNTLDDVIVCEGEPFQLGATDVEDASYEWTGPNNFFAEEQFPTITRSRTSMAGEYAVIGIVSGCATFPAVSEVEVFSLPQPNLGADNFFCSKTATYTIEVLDSSYFAYQWQDQSSQPTFNVYSEGLHWVEVSNEHGCTGRDSVYIADICPTKVYVPNVFSPNFDGINDEFGVYGTDIINMKFSIFDRWGAHLFTSTDQNEFWDGRFKGDLVAQGVYVWQLQVEGFNEDGSALSDVLSGSVMLLH